MQQTCRWSISIYMIVYPRMAPNCLHVPSASTICQAEFEETLSAL